MVKGVLCRVLKEGCKLDHPDSPRVIRPIILCCKYDVEPNQHAEWLHMAPLHPLKPHYNEKHALMSLFFSDRALTGKLILFMKLSVLVHEIGR